MKKKVINIKFDRNYQPVRKDYKRNISFYSGNNTINYSTPNINYVLNNYLTSNINYLPKNEVDTGHAKKMPLGTLVRLSNCICKVKFGPKEGTGFFLKILDRYNTFHFLVSNEHVIEQKYVNMRSELHIISEKGKHYYLTYSSYSKLIKCFPKPTDITIVPLLPANIRKMSDIDFLEMDLSLSNGRGFSQYLGEYVYCLQHPNKAPTHIAMGKIVKIFNIYEFEHSVDTAEGSSGSPIILCSNNKVVGIHKSGFEVNYINPGTFIVKFLIDLVLQKKNK